MTIQTFGKNTENYWKRHSGKIAAIYSIFLVAVFVIPSPKVGPSDTGLHLDKLVHITLFAIHYLVWLRVFEDKNYATIKTVTLSLCFALFTETLQWFISYRSADYYDLLADSGGVVVGILTAQFLVLFQRVGLQRLNRRTKKI